MDGRNDAFRPDPCPRQLAWAARRPRPDRHPITHSLGMSAGGIIRFPYVGTLSRELTMLSSPSD